MFKTGQRKSRRRIERKAALKPLFSGVERRFLLLPQQVLRADSDLLDLCTHQAFGLSRASIAFLKFSGREP